MSMICALIVPDQDAIDHVGVATHLIAEPSSNPSIIIEYRPACAGRESVLSLLRTSAAAL